MKQIPEKSKIKNYTVLKALQLNAENANVYLVENKEGNKFVIKHFCKSVKPFLNRGKKTHFGRRREGAREVFEEIKVMSEKYAFLINFHERFKWENRWCIVIEYIDGETLDDFILKYKNNNEKIKEVIRKLAQEINLWHENNFALGDAHLKNIIVKNEDESVKLIDYGQIHHPTFKYCKKFNCFEPHERRINQDIENKTGNFGKGFYSELEYFEKENKMAFSLKDIFMKEYKNKKS